MNPKPEDLQKLELILSYQFVDKGLLSHALIHRSFLNENRHASITSNERHEFLGDAVIETWVSHLLFLSFPEYNEGEMTNLRALSVCTENLSSLALQLGIGDYIFLSHGEEKNQGRTNRSILADTFESIVGAIFLDGGWQAADEFLNRFLKPSVLTLAKQKVYKDSKSLFQEIAQAQTGITPHYQTLSETGPDHKKMFEVGVYIGDKLIAKGNGSSKQAAEAQASQTGIQILNNQ